MRRECRTSWQLTAKSFSINDTERKSGGCAREAVKLTSGGLSYVSGIGTEQVARLVIVRQKSAKGVVSGVGIRGETLVRKGEKQPVSLESVTTGKARTRAESPPPKRATARGHGPLPLVAASEWKTPKGVEWSGQYDPNLMEEMTGQLNSYLRGWLGYFGRSETSSVLASLKPLAPPTSSGGRVETMEDQSTSLLGDFVGLGVSRVSPRGKRWARAMAPGVCPKARHFIRLFPLGTSRISATLLFFPPPRSPNEPNRRVRTRTHGDAGGEQAQRLSPIPIWN